MVNCILIIFLCFKLLHFFNHLRRILLHVFVIFLLVLLAQIYLSRVYLETFHHLLQCRLVVRLVSKPDHVLVKEPAVFLNSLIRVSIWVH